MSKQTYSPSTASIMTTLQYVRTSQIKDFFLPIEEVNRMRLGQCTDGCRHDEKREGFDREHRKEKSGIIFCLKMPLFDLSPFLYLVCRDVYFSTLLHLLQFTRPYDHVARAYSPLFGTR